MQINVPFGIFWALCKDSIERRAPAEWSSSGSVNEWRGAGSCEQSGELLKKNFSFFLIEFYQVSTIPDCFKAQNIPLCDLKVSHEVMLCVGQYLDI